MKHPFKLVYVEWEDSLGCSAGWYHMDTMAAGEAADTDVMPLMARSVGWIFRESGSSLVLLPHLIDETEQASMQGMGGVTIPRSAIRKMVVLKIPDNSKMDAAARKVLGIKKVKRHAS